MLRCAAERAGLAGLKQMTVLFDVRELLQQPMLHLTVGDRLAGGTVTLLCGAHLEGRSLRLLRERARGALLLDERLLGLRDLHRRMAVRTCLATCINGVAAIWFARGGAVDWRVAALMTAGQVAGGYGGASLVRRVPRAWVRWSVVAIGLGMAAAMGFWGSH